jgi:hypothetical protein
VQFIVYGGSQQNSSYNLQSLCATTLNNTVTLAAQSARNPYKKYDLPVVHSLHALSAKKITNITGLMLANEALR